MKADLNLLLIFDAIGRTGSVTGAAQVLALSQPAVSHALNRLRAVVGDALFTRSGRGLVPTPRAVEMMPEVRVLLDRAAAALSPAAFEPAQSTRSFAIAASDYAAFTLLPALIERIQRAAPAVSLSVRPAGPQVLADLAQGGLDLSFWGDAPPPAPFLYQRLFDEHYVGVARQGHPLFAAGAVDLAGYLRFPHATVSLQTPGANEIDRRLEAMGLARQVALASHSFAGNLAALARTDLLASLPSRLCQPLPPGLRLFDLPLAMPGYGYGLIWHPRTDPLASHRWLRGLIAESAGPHGKELNHS